ncbi:MAG: hypothetical protein ACTS6G_06410 [Candidatus Hodgkinia cicadicola]
MSLRRDQFFNRRFQTKFLTMLLHFAKVLTSKLTSRFILPSLIASALPLYYSGGLSAFSINFRSILFLRTLNLTCAI